MRRKRAAGERRGSSFIALKCEESSQNVVNLRPFGADWIVLVKLASKNMHEVAMQC